MKYRNRDQIYHLVWKKKTKIPDKICKGIVIQHVRNKDKWLPKKKALKQIRGALSLL